MIIDKSVARGILRDLLNTPIAPFVGARYINAGTDKLLSIIEEEYFQTSLPQGVGTFKYLEGDYGTGKTQFIYCLLDLAKANQIVTSYVTVGQECYFNSPASITKAVINSFRPYDENSKTKGAVGLIVEWVENKIREKGMTTDQSIPDHIQHEIKKAFVSNWLTPPDGQMFVALKHIGSRIVDSYAGSQISVTDQNVINWINGDNIIDKSLKEIGLFEPLREDNSFQRLKTVLYFLRERLGYKGFFIAFDEGTRTVSFRRGTTKQKQAVENMLELINNCTEQQGFGGVLFLYSATEDFRQDIVQKYPALQDRIGGDPWLPGSPVTSMIKLNRVNNRALLEEIGDKLLHLHEVAHNVSWNDSVQKRNLQLLLKSIQETENRLEISEIPPRSFIYRYCRLLELQRSDEIELTPSKMKQFIEKNTISNSDEDE